MKKVFLDNLPKKKSTGVNKDKEIVDWVNSIGLFVKFIYDDINGEVEIIDYKSKKSILYIKYNSEIFNIATNNFTRCKLGGIIKEKTSDFKIKIEQMFQDEKRDIVIIEAKYKRDKNGNNVKSYKYKCNKCGWLDGWISEYHLLQGIGCACCYGRIAVLGINTIWDTNKYLVTDYGLDEKFAKENTVGTHKKGEFTCKYCNNARLVRPKNVREKRSIGCNCGDGLSYPEKFTFNVLKQFEIEFQTQLSKTTFNWCDKYRYDFYIPSLNMIIETHGEQHYRQTHRNGGRTLMDEQKNDKLKKELALKNGIENYIIIDCRESNMNFIKENIINSELSKMFDFSLIDWLKCEAESLKNIVKEVCEYWNNKNEDETTSDLANIFRLDKTTISRYLLKGSKLEWCNYIPKKESLKPLIEHINSMKKPVRIIKDGVILREFTSIAELHIYWKEKFNIELNKSCVSSICSGRKGYKSHKGYTFEYIV